MKINCFIIDDEPMARQGLKEYINEVSTLNLIGESSNPVEALSELNELPIDLLFLDINMPKMNGLDFLRIKKTNFSTIITSAYDNYALEGYELNVCDYLLKPFSFERFIKAVTKVEDNKKYLRPTELSEEFFFIKSDGKYMKLYHDDILYIEAFENYVTVYTTDKKILSYLTFGQMEDYLPKAKFIKVHRSYIVSIKKVESVGKEEVKIGSKTIPLAKSMKEFVFKELIEKNIIKR